MKDADFARVQRDLAAHLRDPEHQPAPEGIEERRLQIYRDLVYNNLAGFLENGFPVLRALLPEARWHELIRAFLARHTAHSPYFVDIPAEFLNFLDSEYEAAEIDPPFIQALAHYEWLELVAEVSREEFPRAGVNLAGDLLTGIPVISPLVHVQGYEWPVHRIAPEFQPAEPLAEPVWLVVYRDRHDEVRFMEINAVTARLLGLLRENTERSGRAVLEQIAGEMGAPDAEPIVEFGAQTLETLRNHDIVAGTRI